MPSRTFSNLIERWAPAVRHPSANRYLHWLNEAHRRTQSVSVGVYLDRDLWTLSPEQFKGTLVLNLGPIFIEFGG